MLIRLQGWNAEFAELTLERVAGERAHGHFRLLVTFMAHLRERPEGKQFRLTDFNATLRAGSADDGLLQVVRLAPFDGYVSFDSYPASHSSSFTLVGELDRARIEALEHERRGSDLKWLISVRALATQEARTMVTAGEAEMPLPRSAWLDVLRQAGFQRGVLVEVSLRPGSRSNLAKACSHIFKAHDFIGAGDLRHAVAACRDALESVSLHVGGDDSKATLEGARDLDKEGRILVLRRALKLLPHAAKHADESAAAIDWTDADAEMIVAMTAALVRRYCEA